MKTLVQLCLILTPMPVLAQWLEDELKYDYDYWEVREIEYRDPLIIDREELIENLLRCPVPEQEDYRIECNQRRDEKRAVVKDDVVIHTAADAEKWRCAQVIEGDLRFEPSSKNLEIILPYLFQVRGNVQLEAGINQIDGRMPQLCHVGGTLFFDNRHRTTHWSAPSLKSLGGTLEILEGIFNRLEGFDNLEYIRRLVLRRHPNDDGDANNYYSGLNGVTRIGGDVELNTGPVNYAGPFLSSLENVGGDVQAYMSAGHLPGLANVNHIGGSLRAEWHSYWYSPSTQGLDNLLSVGGDLRFEGEVRNLSGLQNLQQVGGDFYLETGEQDLQDLNSLQQVGSLTVSGGSLNSLNGLQNVSTLGDLFIENTWLQNVSALSNASVPAGGSIIIEENYSLCEDDARSLVRSLRNDPNWNSWDTSTTRVKWNRNCN